MRRTFAYVAVTKDTRNADIGRFTNSSDMAQGVHRHQPRRLGGRLQAGQDRDAHNDETGRRQLARRNTGRQGENLVGAAEGDGHPLEVQDPENQQADDRAGQGAEESQAESLGHEQTQDPSRRGAHGGQGANLAHAFVDAHHHHVEHADQHHGDQDRPDTQGHDIDHAHHVVKRRQLPPGVQFEHGFVLRVGHGAENASQGRGHRLDPVEIVHPYGDFADFTRLHAQQGGGIVDMQIPVPAARPHEVLHQPGHLEGHSVDRSVLVVGHQHHGIAGADVHAFGQGLGQQDFAGGHQKIPMGGIADARNQQRRGGLLFLRIDTVEPDIGGLGVIAQHGAEFDSRGKSRHPGVFGQDGGQFRIGFGREHAVQRQVVHAGHVALAVDLQMAQHGIGDLPHDGALEGLAQPGEHDHRHNADDDQHAGKQGAALVPQQVFQCEAQNFKHGDPPRMPAVCPEASRLPDRRSPRPDP
ncbi:hypothetical protein DESC_460136 [Desulfosarcina cetonica]|nr:hypothetical protein DESC_460136 [Desulfosarcina cetonica]